ncbi:4,4'-diaponeurosporenoate glycosyltransferase [Haloferula luteola]|uniref:4,4'-diaponeurosporenoate glycosyltransferase n=1 Tax=Haloferula luteola TaxID=595692 RepID=A0A840UXX2_9BACT|nr:glycosyltransferase family 2 protein [Haloferula luteola]MBB5350632.1 4,4'-diaponeurosporenoate glycosyltransferase [Haloferula luteola]
MKPLPPAGALGRPPTVSVIIPARNEARNLPILLDSLHRQWLRPLEILVIDDQSEDETYEVARRMGARVISSKPLPAGWLGKPWACQQGADLASGQLLLFVDADVHLQPDAVARLVTAIGDGRAVVSVCPWHRTERLDEQASVFFNLLMVGGIGASGPAGFAAKKIGLFGQVLMISYDHYQRVGGHGVVRRKVLENFHLSRELEAMGVERHSYVGAGSITMRMFPEGFGQLCRSWLKGFSSGAALTPAWAMAAISLWITGLMMVLGAVVMGAMEASPQALLLPGAYGVAALTLYQRMAWVGRFSPWNAVFYPIALLFYQGLFLISLVREKLGHKTRWKGRDVA